MVDKTLRILVVDDHEELRRSTCNLLNTLGFTHLHLATDGSEALAVLGNRPMDLVISDWEMDPMNGIDLLRAMRADPRLAPLPFLMTTARSGPNDRAAARRAGVDAYLVKPFNAPSLLIHMRRALAARRR